MSKKLVSQQSRRKKALKKIKTFFGSGLKTGPAKCPFCDKIFESIRDWGCHIKEEHCR